MPQTLPLWSYFALGFAFSGLILALWRRKKTLAKKAKAPKPLTVGLEKTRRSFIEKLGQALNAEAEFTNELLAELEEVLITADVGVTATQQLLHDLKEGLETKGLQEKHLLKEYLSDALYHLLRLPSEDYEPPQTPHVMMIVGVNGVGKTTSIAKLAYAYREEGNKVLLAAADTFRAGAVNQLKIWSDRVGVTTLSQKEGADPAAVAFDAVQAGVARGMDRVIIDTAGRLHTKVNLMEELKKVKRVINKAMPGAPHEVWLVIDATQGQNALNQARQFHEALGLTGIILTKLDGTAKGGIVVQIVHDLKVPIEYIGIGEKLEDLRHFDAREFVDALLS